MASTLHASPLAQAQLFSVAGVVTDAAGKPLAGVEMMVVRDSGATVATTATRSATDGTFAFQALSAGTIYLRARRIGFQQSVTKLRADTLPRQTMLRVLLEPSAVELATVDVDAMTTRSMLDFHDRRKNHGSGYFIDRADIEKRRPTYTSDLLRYVPGAVVRPSGHIGSSVRVRGCKPSIWIDGVQASGAELDDVTRPSDIDGIEIYGSWVGVPPQFNDRSGKNCGAILVWTRIR